MYSLQCVFISQYSNQVDFISMGEAKVGEMGSNPKLGAMAPLPPFGASMKLLVLQRTLSHISKWLPGTVCIQS